MTSNPTLTQKSILLRFFSEDDHVNSFRSGSIRMMSADYYKKWDDFRLNESNRTDIAENSVEVHTTNNQGEAKLISPIGEQKFTSIFTAVPNTTVYIGNPALDRITKIACFYILSEDDIITGNLSTAIDTKVKEFGSFYCMIYNLERFNERMISSLHDKNASLLPVEYVDTSVFSGIYGPFRKPQSYSWQNEYRLRILAPDPDPYILKLPNLEDITIWGSVDDLLKGTYCNDKCTIPNIKR